jgi:hypothetical protein
MYKFLICAALLLFIILKVPAQKLQPIIGVHGGVNFSIPKILGSYEMITLLNGEELPEREYDPLYRNFGHQLGFSFFVGLNDHFAVGLMPQTATYAYGYNTSLEVYFTNGNPASLTERISKSKIDYINIPLVVNYYIRKAAFTPYLTGGTSYGLLRGARQNVDTRITDYSTSDVNYLNLTPSVNTSEYIRSKFNFFGGVGAQYDLTQMRIALDISYWLGLHNIVNETNRFDSQNLSARTYAISDDLQLDHVVINLSILFPINKVVKKGALDCTTFKTKRR